VNYPGHTAPAWVSGRPAAGIRRPADRLFTGIPGVSRSRSLPVRDQGYRHSPGCFRHPRWPRV